MTKSPLSFKLLLISVFVLSCIPGAGCSHYQDFNTRLKDITGPYLFSVMKWELDAFGEAARKTLFERQNATDVGADKVLEYYSIVEQIRRIEPEIQAVSNGDRSGDVTSLNAELSRLQQRKAALTDIVEHTIEVQIRETLSEQGIFNPVEKYIGQKANFPPVNFMLENPPHLLMVSPRDRIESIREITLLPEMSVEDMEEIEEEVDELGVSSLVLEIGGLATYPSFVTSKGDLRFTINAAAEEWLHQYLYLKPLGFLYLLDLSGIRQNYEIATMNETLAGMVSREIGALVYEKYYEQDEVENEGTLTVTPGFDFNSEMREIRREVDELLARGEIEAAEEFMEMKRRYLAEQGYYIRKLNQAYFAFYGTYSYRPTSISPIGVEMRQLREKSVSLKDFLETAAGMTGRQDLVETLE